jgi:hypothetical protein
MNMNSLLLPDLTVGYPMRTPDLEGSAGRAWLIQPAKPEEGASLGSWLVNVPGAHQFWSWWVLAVVHLREEEHLPPPARVYEEAEYEFTILTVDPKEPVLSPEVAEEEGLAFLMPPDVVEQFHGIIEQDASVVAAISVQEIVKGRISPDQDFRPRWKVLLDETIAAFRSGKNCVN